MINIDDSDFQKDLDNYINTLLPQGLKQGVEKACLVIERDAKINCGIDEGILRASITHDVEETKNTIEGYVGTALEYGLFHHQGTGIYAVDGNGRQTPWVYKDRKGNLVRTVGQKPSPFLKNAADKNKDKINEIINNSLKGGN